MKSLIETPLPTAGGDEGEGGPDGLYFVHPSPSQRLSEPAATLTLPHRKGEEIIREIYFFLVRDNGQKSLGRGNI
ncbi:MAG: hypothetical protein A2V86_09095 [Deltaproteobacteria bacterium RBG_16_49_23]|nr:MAG: hypothetical protein A2V86_09095 [Deltaproteobacteria bacterium RBG_16_49_23]